MLPEIGPGLVLPLPGNLDAIRLYRTSTTKRQKFTPLKKSADPIFFESNLINPSLSFIYLTKHEKRRLIGVSEQDLTLLI
jgi:hypothetical protein